MYDLVPLNSKKQAVYGSKVIFMRYSVFRYLLDPQQNRLSQSGAINYGSFMHSLTFVLLRRVVTQGPVQLSQHSPILPQKKEAFLRQPKHLSQQVVTLLQVSTTTGGLVVWAWTWIKNRHKAKVVRHKYVFLVVEVEKIDFI